MQEIDNISGLPKELFDISSIAREQQKIKVFVVRRKFTNIITIISGIDDKETSKALAREMKKKFGCGGTSYQGEIELQGNMVEKVKDFLVQKGYKKESIED